MDSNRQGANSLGLGHAVDSSMLMLTAATQHGQNFNHSSNQNSQFSFVDHALKAFDTTFTNLNAITPESHLYEGAQKVLGLFISLTHDAPKSFCTMDQPTDDTNIYDPDISLAFSDVMIRNMIRLLSSESLAYLHPKCQKFLIDLFKLFEKNDIQRFKSSFSELLQLLYDLQNFSNEMYKKGKPSVPYQLERFKENFERVNKTSTVYKFHVLSLSFEKPVDCEYLQARLTEVLTQMSPTISRLLIYQSFKIWKLLCLQFVNGPVFLKTSSLNAMERFISTGGLPGTSEIVDEIYKAAVSLMTKFLNGDIYKLRSSELELSFSSFLVIFFQENVKCYDMYFVDELLIFEFLNLIVQMILLYKMDKIKTSSMKVSILSCISSVIEIFNLKCLKVPEHLARDLAVALLNLNEDSEVSPHIVSLLVKVTCLRIIKNLNEDDVEVRRKGVKRKVTAVNLNVSEVPNTELKNFLTIFPMSSVVANKFQSLLDEIRLQQSSEENLENNLKTINICLKVIFGCTLHRLSIEKTFVTEGNTISNVKDKTLIFSANFSVSIMAICKQCLVGSGINFSALEIIILIIDTLLKAQDMLNWESQSLNEACVILSLPWLKMAKSEYHDLKISLLKLKSDQLQAAGEVDANVKLKCLSCLVILPVHIAPLWRIHMLKEYFPKEKKEFLIPVIKLLPLYLHSTGYTMDVSEIILPILDLYNTETKESFTYICGILNCVLSNNSVLVREFPKNDPTALVLKCTVCDNLKPKSAILYGTLNILWLQDLFFKALIIGPLNVRKMAMKNCSNFLNHTRLSEKILTPFLDLLEDPIFEIRFLLINVIKHLMESRTEGLNVAAKLKLFIVSRLQATVIRAESEGKEDLLETLIQTFGAIGPVVPDDLLIHVLCNLIYNLKSTSVIILFISRDQLTEMANARGVKLDVLFKKFKEKIGQHLMELMLDRVHKKINPMAFLMELVDLSGFHNIKSFLNTGSIRYIMAPLGCKATKEASELIELLASQLQTTKSDLIMEYFPHIFTHLMCHHEETEKQAALRYLISETGKPLEELVRIHFQKLLNVLLLRLSSHYDLIFNTLGNLALQDELYKGPKPIVKKRDMAKFLDQRLLGVLTFYDSILLSSGNSVSDKKNTLESLIAVLNLMGPRYISKVRVKLMGTLRLSLQIKEEDFPKVCCAAWKSFVKNIDIQALGQLLNQIMAMLLPLLEIEPVMVADIFEFLVIENQQQLKGYFHDLYFIPEMPELSKVNEVLKEYTEKPCSQEEFSTFISHSLKGIGHESVDVKIHALSKLKKLLRNYQRELHTHFLGRESVDPIVSELISSLLEACKETDPKIRLLIAECFGEIGAIDPGRLELKQRTKKQRNDRLFLSLDNDDFAYNVIQELLRPVLAVDSSIVQDCSFYALQEMLSIYGCRDSLSATKQGNSLWTIFSPEVREILSPLLQSRYKPAHDIIKANITRPICTNNVGKTFKTWITSWTCDLVFQIKQSKPKRVFSACYVILKYDINLVYYLLPYIMFYAIQDATIEEMKETVLEINTVLGLLQNDFTHLSTQIIFSILDYLKQWTHKFSMKSTSNVTNTIESIKNFLGKISQDLLAEASFHCQAYTRSLMHMEMYVKSDPNQLQNQIAFFQKLYVALDEPDGVAGISAIRESDASFKEQILEHEINGQLLQAFNCYENAVEAKPEDVTNHQGLLRCLMGLDKANTALNYASGLLLNKPDWEDKIQPHCVEAAWKLSQWDKLSSFLTSEKCSNVKNWGVGVGKILLSAKEKNGRQFLEHLKLVRNSLTGPLSAAAMEIGGYQRAYHYMWKLHMLTDLEKGARVLLELPDISISSSSYLSPSLDMEKLVEEYKVRRELVQSSMRCQEPVVNLQRVLFTLVAKEKPRLETQMKIEIAHCWILSAKVARKNGYQQHSFGLLEASAVKLPQIFVEEAKLCWTKGDQLQAINILKKGIQEHFSNTDTMFKGKRVFTREEPSQPCAKAKLLLAKYSEEAAVLESTSLIQIYKDVASILPNWEEGHFHYAKYLDRCIVTVERPDRRGDMVKDIIQSYGMSLEFGCRHLFHSMPRMLALWFELGTQIVDYQRSKGSQNILNYLETTLTAVNDQIKKFTKRLPPYQFLVAFPQLISRICHSHSGVASRLQEIIAVLLSTYPQQAMWMMIAVSKSSYKVRVERCSEIFNKVRSSKPDLDKFIVDCTLLADKLLELSNKAVSDSNTFSISREFKSLPKLLEDRKMSKILLPSQSSMSVTLPSSNMPIQEHNPFPQHLVYIQGFEDNVDILSSLQKPKKITIKGSDGKKYPMMCKPKDDLRKDCRLMEFNHLVNRYLKKDSMARRRQLHIRTYTVVPLNEECGLIEWVPNLMGLRPLFMSLYREQGIPLMNGREIKQIMPNLTDSVQKKLEIFKLKFLPRHPPIFGQWFLNNFPDPTTWYLARLAYARTLAVMSMVGYILGLGDRHGENILIDSTSGEAFHVDFNCLFNKGETFDWPERVPFRLTHNLIEAMGPMGYEGVFRQSCEATMRVMRNQTDALMSMLKPFIHDPLVEWGRVSKGSKSSASNSGEITNEKALIHVRDIELRLKGIVRCKNKPQGLPLSIEGQVDYLIKDATDEINLCQMYVGWSAFM